MQPSRLEERLRKRLATFFFYRYCAFGCIAVLALGSIAVALTDGDFQVYLVILLFVVLLAAGIPIYLSNRRRKSVVLWIRRFHRGAESRMEQQFLEAAVLPWGTLVTLADSSLQSASGLRQATWLMVLMAVGIVLAGALGLLRGSNLWSLLLLLALYAWNWNREGKVVLTPGNWAKKLADLKARLRRPRSAMTSGLSGVVLNCPLDTDHWRSVIESLAPMVDAAIVSVPESTPQVEWELATLRATLGLNKIIVITNGVSVPAVAAGGQETIQVPEAVSWWHDYHVSYLGRRWKGAMTTVLRALESDRP